MAIAEDDDYANTTVNDTTSTWTHVCGANATTLFVAIRGHDGAADVVTGVTYNSVALTRIGFAYRGTNDRWCSLWYLDNPSVGSHDVVVTNSTTAIVIACSASYTGAGTPTTNATDTQDGSSVSTSLTTVANNSWVVSLAGCDDVPSADGTTTIGRSRNSDGILLADTGAAVSPAGSRTLNFTTGFGHWAFIKVELPEASSATTSFPFPPLSRRLQGIYTR